MTEQPENAARVALEKHGLSHLRSKRVAAWSDEDVDKLIHALAEEGIAPILHLSTAPDSIKQLLDISHCRRCGQCCTSSRLNQDDPGVMFFDKEFKLIAKHSQYTYKQLKDLSTRYRNIERDDIRHLPLPCLFHREGKCTVYNIRPFVCKIYPIREPRLQDDKLYINLSLRCDYGKDIYRYLVHYQKAMTLSGLFQ